MPRRGAGAGCGRAQGADRRRLGRQLADGVVGHQHIKADPTANLDTAVATHKAMAHTTASGHCLTVQSMWGPAGLGLTKPAAGLFPDCAVEAKMVPSSPHPLPEMLVPLSRHPFYPLYLASYRRCHRLPSVCARHLSHHSHLSHLSHLGSTSRP